MTQQACTTFYESGPPMADNHHAQNCLCGTALDKCPLQDRQTKLRIAMIGGILFCAELTIMMAMGQLGLQINPWMEVMWDASLVTLIGAGASYWLIFYPLFQKLPSGNTMRRLRLVSTLSTMVAEFALIIFTTEGVIMLVQGMVRPLASPWSDFIDATVLTLVTMPFIKHWIIPSLVNAREVRPLSVVPVFIALTIPSLLMFFSLSMAFSTLDTTSTLTLALWGGLFALLILGLWAFAQTVVHWNRAELALENYASQLESIVEKRTRQLVHAERLANLGTFSANMAHEINNPNAFIAGNAHFLKLYWEKVTPILQQHGHEDESGRVVLFLPEIVDIVNGIVNSSRSIAKILDGLKSYDAKDFLTCEMVKLRLSAPIRDAASLLVHEFSQGVKLESLVADEIMVTCDRQQICQVFVNLFRNAMEAMEGGQSDKEKWIRVIASPAGDDIVVTVQDNGPGIPVDMVDKIFEPFFTTRGEVTGTGLGLSTCQGIIEKHGGRIHVESPRGEGAKFTLYLPST